MPMLSSTEITAREQAALQDCADFEEIITAIIYAGLEGRSGIVVHDADGKPMPARLMTRNDILEFVRQRFGPLFVEFCKQRWQFRNH
jgi:hypothetical protein